MDLHYDAELHRSRYYVHILSTCLPGTGDAEENLTVEILSDDASDGETMKLI